MMTEFNGVSSLKINMQKPMSFMCANNNKLDAITIVSEKMNYLGINITRYI